MTLTQYDDKEVRRMGDVPKVTEVHGQVSELWGTRSLAERCPPSSVLMRVTAFTFLMLTVGIYCEPAIR